MRDALTPVAALLIGVAILLTGQGLQGTLVPVRAGLENFSTLTIGIIGAGYFFGFTVGCVVSGSLVRRVGHVRVFAAMTALASAVPLLHGLWAEPWFWGVLRFVAGFCLAVLYVVIESWLNEKSDNTNRGTVFAVYAFITLTVMAVGQMMLLLYDPLKLKVFAMVSVLVSLAAIPVALSKAPQPAQPETVSIRFRELYKISPAGFLGCLAAGFANGAFWSLAPVFTAYYEDGVTLAAWFMTAGVVGGAIGQWPLGVLSDSLGRRQILVVAGLGATLIGAFFVFTSKSLDFWTINLLGAAWGAMAFPLYSVSVAHANDYAQSDEFVRMSSGLLLIYGAGATLGPFLASAIMTLIGARGLYAFCAVTHLSLTLYVLLRAFRRDAAPEEDQVPFSEAFAATYTASQVYEGEAQEEEAVAGSE